MRFESIKNFNFILGRVCESSSRSSVESESSRLPETLPESNRSESSNYRKNVGSCRVLQGCSISSSSHTQLPSLRKEMFHNEKARLESFHSWPLSYISPQALSKAGFFYTGQDDKVWNSYQFFFNRHAYWGQKNSTTLILSFSLEIVTPEKVPAREENHCNLSLYDYIFSRRYLSVTVYIGWMSRSVCPFLKSICFSTGQVSIRYIERICDQ